MPTHASGRQASARGGRVAATATIAAKPAAAARSRTIRRRSARSEPAAACAWTQASATTSASAARDQRGGRAAARATAVRQDRRKHPDGEVRQHRGQALGQRLRRDRLTREDGVERDADHDQADRDERLAEARRPGPQRDPAHEREQHVEGGLDGERPHRRVERQDRLRALVLQEDEEQRQLLDRRQPHARLSCERPEQQCRAGDRQVVGRDDPADAVHDVGAHARRRPPAEPRGDPRPEQQEPRQHEEEHEADPHLRQDVAAERALPGGRAHRGQRVQPGVEGEDAECRDAAQAVQRVVAARGHRRRHWRGDWHGTSVDG